MSNFNVEISELRNPIYIVHKKNITDEDNIICGEKLVKDLKLFSKVNRENIYKESNEGYQDNYVETLTFTIRYINQISYDNIIFFKNKLYEIIDIDNIKFENRWIKLRAKAIENDIKLDLIIEGD